VSEERFLNAVTDGKWTKRGMGVCLREAKTKGTQGSGAGSLRLCFGGGFRLDLGCVGLKKNGGREFGRKCATDYLWGKVISFSVPGDGLLFVGGEERKPHTSGQIVDANVSFTGDVEGFWGGVGDGFLGMAEGGGGDVILGMMAGGF